MKTISITGWFLVLMVCCRIASAQNCNSITPVFTVNLAGQPNGSWTSPPVQRDGHCCSVTGSNKCLEFDVTLDSTAANVLFEIVSGAVPGGSMFYQINCGPPVQVGQPVCVTGPGPHIITFCKPGNNTNTYMITSIPDPALNGIQWISQACTGQLTVAGLSDTSIHWTSIPYNAAYNAYLNCTSGCDSVIITPTAPMPAYVDYQVCGYPAGGCLSAYFCDTMRVYFVNNLSVSITPQNPVICYGGITANVTATPSGGLAPYQYVWSNGATTQNITAGVGTYTVSVTDAMNCSVANDAVTVTAMSLPISANAGPDQLVCLPAGVQLSGYVTGAAGGQWSGGSGTFTPGASSLNASYQPSAGEIAAGNLSLQLVTTGNNTCPADTDNILITLSASPAPVISGNATVCGGSVQSYSTSVTPGISSTWTVAGGTVTAMVPGTITVQWPFSGSGSVSLTQTNAAGCDSTVVLAVNIITPPAPVIAGSPVVCTGSTVTYSVASLPGITYSWAVTGGLISGFANGNSVNVYWGVAGSGTVTVTETNAAGCDSAISAAVSILTMPSPDLTGPQAACEGEYYTYSTPAVPGNSYSWSTVNGTVLGVSNNQVTIQWNNAGTGTVMLTEYNSAFCDSTLSLNVIVGQQPAPVVAGSAVECTSYVSSYSVTNPVPGDSYAWTASGGNIIGPLNQPTVTIQWITPGTGQVGTSFQHIGILSLEFHVDKLSRPLL